MKRFPLVFAAFTVIAALPLVTHAADSKKTPAKKGATKSTGSKAKVAPAPSPSYVTLARLKKWQATRARNPKYLEALPILQPLLEGKSLKGKNMQDLATNPPLVVVNAKVEEVEVGADADAENGVADTEAFDNTEDDGAEMTATAEVVGTDDFKVDDATIAKTGMDGQLIAQAFPASGVRPAPIRSKPLKTVTPKWVRYPLEFQLAGIGLGTKAVDKDKFNRIDRYGLFAIHGNPTAVVVPTGVAGLVISNMQQPPEVSGLFPGKPGGRLPDWASAIMVSLDNNHVQWLYRRETYSMGFVVDRLGYVDAIVVAGINSPITKTQLEDPVHTVKLGDDLRKVLFRYGYPDSIETYKITERVEGDESADVARAPEDSISGLFEADKESDAGVEEPYNTGNTAFRTFEVRYEQSYNIVFTIRNNRVVRIYIFGDPDFFNAQRRNILRTQYN